MGELEQSNITLTAIQQEVNLKRCLTYIKQIDALKTALDSVNKFHENAIKYARLEAAALMRVVELGGIGNLRGTHRHTALWLSGLSATERNEYIKMCEEGLTIDQVYKREVESELKAREGIERARDIKEFAIEDLKEKGIVDLSYYSKELRKHFLPDIANDLIDGVRNALLEAGGVGAGDSIYVAVKPENTSEIVKALKIRYENLINVIESMKEIAEAANLKIPYSEIDNRTAANEHSYPYRTSLMISLATAGIVEAGEDFYERLNVYYARQDVDYVLKQFNTTKKKAREIVMQSWANEEESDNE